ncbi:MAG: HAD family hydrolase [Pseudomonadota bacterium]
MIKGILLDLDNTLYEYEPLHNIALKPVQAYCQNTFHLSADEFIQRFHQAKVQVKNQHLGMASSHNRLLYMQKLCEILEVNPLRHALKLYNLYWDTFLEHLELSNDGRSFFETVAATQICLVTDLTSHIQYRKLDKLGLTHFVDAIVSSEEAGHEKPHPYPFLLALQKLKLKVHEVIMVGDHYEKDIVGAHSLGIKSYWLTHDTKGVVPEEGVVTIQYLEDIPWQTH